MSHRLGGALTDHIRRNVYSQQACFVLVEGVSSAVAEGMASAWDTSLPRLAIVASDPVRFGEYALIDVSGTRLRNETGSNGLVLVLCDGEQVPDRQSLNFFEPISPSILLETPQGMAMLASQPPSVGLDGPLRAVREAINQAGVAARPSAVAVAAYLDEVAAGNDPLGALPTLGAYTDKSFIGQRVDADRIADNFSLAARRTSEEYLRASAYIDLRRRAMRVLARRPSLSAPDVLNPETDRVMTLLQSGSTELLRSLKFDEAREIFERKSLDLADIVKQELGAYRTTLDMQSRAAALPWSSYEKLADLLRRAATQRDAARDFCDLDTTQLQRLFSKDTRKKLERLLRDKAISGSNPSSPESAIIRAMQQLDGGVASVRVLSPIPPIGLTAINRSGASRVLTLACSRFRLGRLMRAWSQAGKEIDGLLLKPADDEDLPTLMSSFGDAGLGLDVGLPPLQLRLTDAGGNTVQVDWRPDLDDVAMLRSALLFAEQPSLTLHLPVEPTLHAFCGFDAAVPAPVDAGVMYQLGSSLQRTAQSLLAEGISPNHLKTWVTQWEEACGESESVRSTLNVEGLALAGAVRGANSGAVALSFLSPLKAEWVAQYHEAMWQLIDEATSTPDDVVATAAGVARATATHHPAHIRLTTRDRPLLPTSEGRVWSLYGGSSSQDESGFAGEALRSVITQLLTLQPEAAGHLRCLAWGSGAADLLTRQAVKLIDTVIGGARINRIEIFCVGNGAESKPTRETLSFADDELRGSRDVLQIRYIDSLDRAQELLKPSASAPAVHLALVTGLTDGGQRLQIESPEVTMPLRDREVLFAPRVWQRPRQDRRTLLMPPATTASGRIWLRLQNAVEDEWPLDDLVVRVPEVRTGTLDIASQLKQIHDLALWVATLDRYATRDSLEQALGRDNVAILHQERRLGGDSPLSLVLSQRSGGPADRAIGRSLRAAGIITEPDVALSVGTELRQVASQGYGILALQAATSGSVSTNWLVTSSRSVCFLQQQRRGRYRPDAVFFLLAWTNTDIGSPVNEPIYSQSL